jgi:hypothetical protein
MAPHLPKIESCTSSALMMRWSRKRALPAGLKLDLSSVWNEDTLNISPAGDLRYSISRSKVIAEGQENPQHI